uniref:Uncharacterized protein n=1 Tax=Anguilla anguilla TaxID=7936 RepID=A0A0E9SUW3_ANGAN
MLRYRIFVHIKRLHIKCTVYSILTGLGVNGLQ